MALIKKGYWPNAFWGSGYWAADYWPEYGGTWQDCTITGIDTISGNVIYVIGKILLT